MPVNVITAPQVADRVTALSLCAMNHTVAQELTLKDGDVYSTLRPVEQIAVLGHDETQPWVIATIHGRRRGSTAMSNAAAAVRDVLTSTWHLDPNEIWVQWVLT